MKWYKQNYVNRRDWIMENINTLGLSAEETVLALLIDFMQEKGMEVGLDSLAAKSGFSMNEVNEALALLDAKGYLSIRAEGTKITYDLSGMFETDIARSGTVLDSSLFDTFESEFGRPLSQKEMEKISCWNADTDKTMILYALREASAYGKLSFPYIDGILREWKKKNLTVKQIESGEY